MPPGKYQFATELPKDFSGILHFTNFSEEEFKAKWNSIEYTFPPKSTIPLVISTASPIETFNIRMMFAKQLADREFKKSKRFGDLASKNSNVNSIHAMVSYTDTELDKFINRCLEPLPIAQVKAEEVPTEGKKRGRPKTVTIVQDQNYGGEKTDKLSQGETF